MLRRAALCALIALAAGLGVPVSASAVDTPPVPSTPTTPQDRSVEPVVVTGDHFAGWSAGPDITAREPQVPTNYETAVLPVTQSDCRDGSDAAQGDHSCYQPSRIPNNPNVGADVNKMLGYRWDGSQFVQIPFQVDEKANRYLTNNASGFAYYSGVDQHQAYIFDTERFRYTTNDPANPCLATPKGGIKTTPDPVKGLDDNDEVAFMWADAGAKAPSGAALPAGITDSRELRIDDPSDPNKTVFAYVMLAADGGPTPAYTTDNSPYVRYKRDADADIFQYSQSSYSGYGNAPKGTYCDAAGNLVLDANGNPKIAQRRPKDTAWIYTPRYAFRYDGRWLMTQMKVAPQDLSAPGADATAYGPDLIDQYKARAFQQRPGGQTPCCGYEEEVNNWGGSSILMGERVGPVRAIRETWGADSSTNNVRREMFYAREMRFIDFLRVHVIPPADGIYVQWDYNAGAVDTYYNAYRPEGVAVDGWNDEVFGNLRGHVGPDGVYVRDEAASSGPLHDGVVVGDPKDDSSCNQKVPGVKCVYNDFDEPDATFSGPTSGGTWEQISGPNGGWVTRWGIKQVTGGAGYQVVTSPYYRDDSCFDDGTGSSPGPHLRSRAVDNEVLFAGIPANAWQDPADSTIKPRACWRPGDVLTGDPGLDRRYWQGDIATHGLHVQIIADSDNAAVPFPLTEIDSEQRNVVVGPNSGNVGETYGRGTEFPLAVTVAPRA